MTNTDELAVVSRLINCQGDPCDFGCSEGEVDRMKVLSKQLFPEKPYRVVRKWTWGDIEVDEAFSASLTEVGILPAFLIAEMVEDETEKFDSGLKVKTTPLVSFSNNCLFVTRNTAYILVGRGTRMTVSLGVYHALSL